MRESERREKGPLNPAQNPCPECFPATESTQSPSSQPIPPAPTLILSHHYDPNTSKPRTTTPDQRNRHVSHNRPSTGDSSPRDRHAYWKKRSENTTSYYFTRFPDNWSLEPLWEIFARFGTVNDLYIPLKRNIRGERFGFVRFQDVGDAVALEQKLDQILIGETKLSVNLSRFGRKQAVEGFLGKVAPAGRKSSAQEAASTRQRQDHYLQALLRPAAESREREGKNVKVREEREGKNEPDRGNWFALDYKVSKESMAWLENCYVGVVRNPKDISLLQEKLQMEGHGSTKSTPVGGNLVLLKGEGEAKIQELISYSSE